MVMAETDRRVQVLANARCLYGPDIEVITFAYPSKRAGKGVDYQAAVMKRQNSTSDWVNILYSHPSAPTRKKAMQILLKKTEDELVKQLTDKGVCFPLVGDAAGFKVLTVDKEDVVSVSEGSEASDFEFVATPASSSDGEFVDDTVFDEEGEPSQPQAESKSEYPESRTVEDMTRKSLLDSDSTDTAIPTGSLSHDKTNSFQKPADLRTVDGFWAGWTAGMAKNEERTRENVEALCAEAFPSCTPPSEKMEVKPSKLNQNGTWTTLPQPLSRRTAAPASAADQQSQSSKEDLFKSLDPWGAWWPPVKSKDAKQVAFSFSNNETAEKFDGLASTSQQKLKSSSDNTTKILPEPQVGIDEVDWSLDWSQWGKSKKKKKKILKEDAGFCFSPAPNSNSKMVEASDDTAAPPPEPEDELDNFGWSQWGKSQKKKKKVLKEDVNFWASPAPSSNSKGVEASPENFGAISKKSNAGESGSGEMDNPGEKFYEAPEHRVESNNLVQTKSGAAEDLWGFPARLNKRLSDIDDWPYPEPVNNFPPLKSLSDQTSTSASDTWGFNVSKDQERHEKSKPGASEFAATTPASPRDPTTSEYKVKANLADDDFGWDAFITGKGKGKESTSDSSSPNDGFAFKAVREGGAASHSSPNEPSFGTLGLKKPGKSEETISSNEDFEWKILAGKTTTDVDRDDATVSELSTTPQPASAPVLAQAQMNYRMNVLGDMISNQVGTMDNELEEVGSRGPTIEEVGGVSLEQAVPTFFLAASRAREPQSPPTGESNMPETRLFLLTLQHNYPSGNETFRVLVKISSNLKKAVIDEASRYMTMLSPLVSSYYDRKIDVVSAKGPDGDIDLTMLDDESWREILAYLGHGGQVVEMVVNVEDIDIW